MRKVTEVADVVDFLNGHSCFFIVKQAVNAKQIFMKTVDYKYYLRLLRKYKVEYNIKILGYCLLPGFVYLVLQPKNPRVLSIFIHEINQAYENYFNARYKTRGMVWKPRYKSRVLGTGQDLFESIKFIEFIPVKALMAETPAKYPWSSCSHRVMGAENRVLDNNLFS